MGQSYERQAERRLLLLAAPIGAVTRQVDSDGTHASTCKSIQRPDHLPGMAHGLQKSLTPELQGCRGYTTCHVFAEKAAPCSRTTGAPSGGPAAR